MPNIKSAIKRVKVNEKKSLRNRMIKSQVKTAMKKYAADSSATQYAATTSAIDKAVSKGVMHKKTANRQKARLAKALASN